MGAVFVGAASCRDPCRAWKALPHAQALSGLEGPPTCPSPVGPGRPSHMPKPYRAWKALPHAQALSGLAGPPTCPTLSGLEGPPTCPSPVGPGRPSHMPWQDASSHGPQLVGDEPPAFDRTVPLQEHGRTQTRWQPEFLIARHVTVLSGHELGQ